MRKRCILGFLALFAGQGTATLVINNYGPELYSSLGENTVTQLILQGAWISVCPFGNLLNSLIVDKTGRIKLMMVGLTGVIVALVGECITVSLYNKTGDKSLAAAAVFFLFLHIAFYSSSMDATTYIYATEIFPTPVRAKGLAVSIAGLFSATIIFLEAAPTAFAHIGWRYYTVFIAVTTVMIILMYFFFPEVRWQQRMWLELLLTKGTDQGRQPRGDRCVIWRPGPYRPRWRRRSLRRERCYQRKDQGAKWFPISLIAGCAYKGGKS